MSAPILLTKLFVPAARPELVSRSHLIEQLNHGLQRKITLISAPAGFGKTTLVTDWLYSQGDDSSSPFLVSWLSLDEGDNDVARFLTYLISALNRLPGLEPEIGVGALQMIQAPQPPPPETVLITVINELALATQKIVLILDDYHLIDSQPVHESLNFLIENLPPQLHFVITTREDPPIQMARLRARGQLNELRAVDLRFTLEEAANFLNQVMGLNLSTDDIAALETRTEGWIAGLQMAAISMQGSQDVEGFIRSFTGSHRYVLDYLIEEVLEQQPESVQTFMLQSAILDRLTGSLCDVVRFGYTETPSSSKGTAVTGQENGQEILEMLDRANLFIIPLDEERRWYRYHHLFADLLRQRLRQTQPEKLPVLHIRASEWFTHQGLHQEAIKHSLVARDYQGAAQLIRAVGIDIMQQGKHTTVLGWINAFPKEFVKEHPYLSVLYGWALQLTGQLESSEAHLLNAENALDNLEYREDEDVHTVLGLIHTRRAYLTFLMGESDKTISYARQAMEQLPETAVLIRAQTATYLGVAYHIQGQLQAAVDTYNGILPTIQRMGGNSTAVSCYFNLGDLYTQMAQLHRAKEIYEQALQFTEQHTGRPDMPFCGYVYVSIGRILRQWNQLEDAYRFTTKGVALCRDWNVAQILALSCIDLAFVHQALGNGEQSRESLQEAIQIMDGFSPWGTKAAIAHQVKFDLASGDIDAVERWTQANDLTIDGDFEFDREIEYLTLVRVFIAQKRFEKAYALGQKIYRFAQDIGKRQLELDGLILLALVFSVQGETDQALVHLKKAVNIAQPEGYIRIFVDEGPPMARLLYAALSRGITPDYVQRLLAAFPETEPEKTTVNQPKLSDTDWIEPLSNRELEVLQLIAEGLSRQGIAAQLVLSLNTIKTHTRNIYSKLGVNNQMQAVGKARGLGLLENE